MIKDITLGQYFPGKSVLHRLDPRMKLGLAVLYIVMLFVAKGFLGLAVGVVFLVVSFLISGIPIKMMAKSVKPIVPIIIFTGILNLFFVSTGDVVFSWTIIKITTDGIRTMIFMADFFCGGNGENRRTGGGFDGKRADLVKETL